MDDLAEELLVDLPKDFHRNLLEDVGAGIVHPPDNLLKHFIVNLQPWGKAVRAGGLVFFRAEVEQAGVVLFISVAEELQQGGVDGWFLREAQQLFFRLQTAVLADAQEDDAVDGHLYGIVELAFGQVAGAVAQGDIACQQVAPCFNIFEESVIYLGGAFFAFGFDYVAVKRAAEDGLG